MKWHSFKDAKHCSKRYRDQEISRVREELLAEWRALPEGQNEDKIVCWRMVSTGDMTIVCTVEGNGMFAVSDCTTIRTGWEQFAEEGLTPPK